MEFRTPFYLYNKNLKTKNNQTIPALLLLFLIAGTFHSLTASVSPDSLRVSGIITDSLTGYPIKNVVVKIENNRNTIRTDSLGHYTLTAFPGSMITFFLPGYAEKGMKITGKNLNLKLSPQPIETVEEILRYKLKTIDLKIDTTRRTHRDTIRIRGTNPGKQTGDPLIKFEIGKR